ncbi:collagen binding domain-containing protein [Prevotella sp. 10(H)]|uniref:MSCRAMM family protein n=1 Tax=Prevotella sp. 10(H) TaxID=1158294 RepID=UPI0004A71B4A|nr:prealbumin-like fold domain-containing protein [Prevotella sp. 10(H)]
MKNNFLIYLLLFFGLYACTDDSNDVEMAHFTISAKNVATNELISGGTYQVLNIDNQVVATYTLDKGTVEVTNLPAKNYTIVEVTAPKGYVGEEKQMQYLYFNRNSKDFIFQYIDEETRELPESVKVKFFSTEARQVLGEYNAVRVGEYYWVDQNFNHFVKWGNDFENIFPITQDVLNKYLERIRINPSQFQLQDINNFEKYYGRYYSYPSILYMNKYGVMRDQNNNDIKGWKIPAPEDYRQLFAMSPFNTTNDAPHTRLNERDVRFALSPRPNENPMAYNIADPNGGSVYKTYWFDQKNNTNKYKFNLMPGGARLNGDGPWCNGLGPVHGCYPDGKKGDIYHLFYTAYMAVQLWNDELSVGAVMLHDNVDTKEALSYHLLNVRWCRRLSDIELGYKLYINDAQTDIKKLDMDAPAPTGYKELPHGYVRGFYVQYILNNPGTSITVSDIVHYARNVEDNYTYENRANTDIIF